MAYPKFEVGVYPCFNITNISDNSITIYNPHRNTINLSLYHNDEGYYFFLDRNYIVRGSAFDDSSNNIYGLLLKDVNTWIICDFPLYPVNGIELYLELYYKHNPVVEPAELVEPIIIDSAETVHKRICDNFEKVERTLYEICVDLKSVRDNKYYKSLGYDTFEDYCLKCFNLNRRTVYRYISVAENLSIDFVTSMSQNGVGVTKLDILSRLSESERNEILNTTDIEHTSVKQLEHKSKEIKQSREVRGVDVSSRGTSSPTAIKTTDKETLFINKFGKKMNALLKFMKDEYNWLFSVNGVSYKTFLGTNQDLPCYDFDLEQSKRVLSVLPVFCQALKDTANGIIEKDSKADEIKEMLLAENNGQVVENE